MNQSIDTNRCAPPFRPIRLMPGTPPIEGTDSRIKCYSDIGLDVEPILDWLNPKDTIFRRNRQQILDCFPILIPALAHPPRTVERTLLDIEVAIDRGSPLVEAMCRAIGVRRETLRGLMRLSPAEVGLAWCRNPIPLFRAAGVTPSNRMPQSAPEWDAYRWYWTLSGLGRIEGDCATSCDDGEWRFLGEHIFPQICSLGYSNRARHRLLQMTEGQPDRIVHIRDYAEFVAGWCADRWPDLSMSHESFPTLSESFLARYPLPELIRQSVEWHSALLQDDNTLPLEPATECQPEVTAWPPLLETPICQSGVVAVSLVCPRELREEGARLQHCVGSYVRRCHSGDSHIIAMRDSSGQSLSTAELNLHQNEDGEWLVSVRQHFGLMNRQAPSACVRHLDLVVEYLNSSEKHSELRKIAAMHKERRRKFADCLYSDDPEQASASEALLRKIVPDLDLAITWLAWESDRRNASAMQGRNADHP